MKGCRPLTEKEIKEIMDSFSGKYAARDRALFILGIKSGFLISEILSLRINDVCQHGHITNYATVQRRYMKKKIEGRSIFLHPEAKTALQEWIDELTVDGDLDSEGYVFKGRKGSNKPISRVQAYRILKNVYEECQLDGKLGTHTMRKTFADRVYQNLDRDLVKTQRALGHKNINSTVSYMSFRQEEIDKAILAI